jgi:hypothetical protein
MESTDLIKIKKEAIDTRLSELNKKIADGTERLNNLRITIDNLTQKYEN